MADLAFTEARTVKFASDGSDRIVAKIAKMTGPTSNLAAGNDITISELPGFNRVFGLIPMSDCSGYVPVLDVDDQEVIYYYADYEAGADGALIAVADAVDLDAVSCWVMLLGA